jgi:hypothetical protein
MTLIETPHNWLLDHQRRRTTFMTSMDPEQFMKGYETVLHTLV